MYLDQLKQFIAVAELGSVTRAAELLHVSQPAVSYSLKALEDELGVSLFKRVKKRLTLTDEGQYYFEHVRSIMDQLHGINEEMKDISERKKPLKIGIPPMIGTILFPRIFANFNDYAKDIVFELVEGGSFELMDEIERETIDIAIVASKHNIPPANSALSYKKLSTTELVYCVSSSHPLADKKVLDITELADEHLILFKEGYIQAALVSEAFQQADVKLPIILRTNQLLTIITFIQRNIASSFFFYDVAKKLPGISFLSLNNRMLLDLDLVWKSNRPLFRETRLFFDYLKKDVSLGDLSQPEDR